MRSIGSLLRITGDQDELAMARAVETGLAPDAIESLLKHGVPESFVFSVIVPKRTFQRRRERQERLSPNESDRAERMARLVALATVVFDNEQRAVRWLSSPKLQFGDRAPFDLLRTKAGTDVVERVLLRAYFGYAA